MAATFAAPAMVLMAAWQQVGTRMHQTGSGSAGDGGDGGLNSNPGSGGSGDDFIEGKPVRPRNRS
ncbi:hypothetical protein [Candidatus Amarolinea dominans]|uniref:hypothetical protein n=1 Tax=Candidatus Amarolinea dominans TaxID=3140696 RepID=UPI00313669DB|nr:hypothetical protein [Anaerolineae bacterium]